MLAWVLPGFIFLYQVRHKSVLGSKTDYQVIVMTAIFAAIIILVTRVLIQLGKSLLPETWIECMQIAWHKVLPFEFTFSWGMSCLLAFVLAELLNKFSYKLKRDVEDNTDKLLEKKLWPLLVHQSEIENSSPSNPWTMLNLINDRVYVGWITAFEIDGRPEDNFIEILPIMSGYRANPGKNNRRINFTTAYAKRDEKGQLILKKNSEGQSVKIIILMSQISTFSKFEPEIFGQFIKEQGSEQKG